MQSEPPANRRRTLLRHYDEWIERINKTGGALTYIIIALGVIGAGSWLGLRMTSDDATSQTTVSGITTTVESNPKDALITVADEINGEILWLGKSGNYGLPNNPSVRQAAATLKDHGVITLELYDDITAFWSLRDEVVGASDATDAQMQAVVKKGLGILVQLKGVEDS